MDNNVQYAGRGYYESDSSDESDIDDENNNNNSNENNNNNSNENENEDEETLDELIEFAMKLKKAMGDRLTLGFNETVSKTATTLTDGAGNVYHGFQEEFATTQEKIKGYKIIQDKRHCDNHEIHLFKDEKGKDLKTIIDDIIDLITDVRSHFRLQDSLNILIETSILLSTKIVQFDKLFEGRWISHAKTEFKKLDRLLVTIFIALISEIDKLFDSNENVRASDAFILLTKLKDNLWNFYFAFDFVRIIGKLNSKWQSHTNTVIDAEIRLQESESALDAIDVTRIPSSIRSIDRQMKENYETKESIEEIKISKPWAYIKRRVTQLVSAFPAIELNIYSKNKESLTTALSGESIKARGIWQLYFILFNFHVMEKEDFEIDDIINNNLLYNLKHLQKKFQVKDDDMNRDYLIDVLYDRLKCINLNCSKQEFKKQYRALVKFVIKRYDLKNKQTNNKTHYTIICEILNPKQQQQSKGIRNCVNKAPAVVKCMLFCWFELHSNATIEEYGHMINLAKGPLQHRMKILLLDCLLHIIINGPRLGYSEQLIERCIKLSRKIGMRTASAPFKRTKIPVCQQIMTQTSVKVNKNKLGDRERSIRQIYIENRHLRDQQKEVVFGEGFVDISKLLGIKEEGKNDSSEKKSDK